MEQAQDTNNTADAQSRVAEGEANLTDVLERRIEAAIIWFCDNPNLQDIRDEFFEIIAEVRKAEREACEREMVLDLWDALLMHEANGDTCGSLRASLLLSKVGDEIKERSNK